MKTTKDPSISFVNETLISKPPLIHSSSHKLKELEEPKDLYVVSSSKEDPDVASLPKSKARRQPPNVQCRCSLSLLHGQMKELSLVPSELCCRKATRLVRCLDLLEKDFIIETKGKNHLKQMEKTRGKKDDNEKENNVKEKGKGKEKEKEDECKGFKDDNRIDESQGFQVVSMIMESLWKIQEEDEDDLGKWIGLERVRLRVRNKLRLRL
ncbi:hypothetical protein Droror1_Dr00018183 [Drosera rotundifolia]